MTYSKMGTDTKTGERVDIFKLSRLLGLYIIGLQGMGKSGLLEELIVQDMKQEIGVCVLDPHGELVDNIIARLPDEKKEEKVISLDLAETQYFFGLNLFASPDPTSERNIAETRNQVLHVFEKAFGISPSTPLMYDLLHKVASVLIANPGYTMADISLFLTSEACRKILIQQARPDIRAYWERWDDTKLKSPKDRDEERQTILNKLNDFEDDPLRFIVGQSHSTIDLRQIMDEGRILLVKLDRRLEKATKLVGSIIVALILAASASRQARGQFHLYADEFQNFATEDFAVLLEEARKSAIGITMAHQNRAQLELSDRQADKNLKARTLNVGNLVVFRVPTDAEELVKQFKATPKPPDIIGQEPVMIRATSGVFDRLIQGHPNKAVMHFMETYVMPFLVFELRELSRSTFNSSRKYRLEALKQGLEILLNKTNAGEKLGEIPASLKPLTYLPSRRWEATDLIKYAFATVNATIEMNLFIPTGYDGERYSIGSGPQPHIIVEVSQKHLQAPDGRFNPDWIDDAVIEEARARFEHIAYFSVGYKWKSEEVWEKAVREIAFEPDREQIRSQIIKYFQPVEKFLICLREALEGLAQEPVMVDTGRFTPKYGPEETIANAQARLATELVMLPKITAQVKLSDGSGNPVEHTIQTFAPGKGFYGRALRDRRERIRQRNIRDGYLIDRANVEAEIAQRQQALAQPMQVEQSRPALTPQAQRRVLLCSSCGTSNQQGSLFCNRCGTRL